MSLSQRLQRVQEKLEVPLPELEPMSILEMEKQLIDFGNTHKGKTYKEMWEKEQSWVSWFVSHYQKSPKKNHRLFIRYVTSMVERAEVTGQRVPVLPSEKDLDPHTGKGYGKKSPEPKARSKPMASSMPIPEAALDELNQLTSQGQFDPEEMAEMESFEVIQNEPSHPEIGHLESRMLNLENALSRVIQHLEVMSAQPQTPEDRWSTILIDGMKLVIWVQIVW